MKKLLVCEDEESIRALLVVLLERAGYTVLQAESGEEALEQAAREPEIRVALLDVMLPGIDGFEVCQRLREEYPAMGIIMLTARTQEAEKVDGLRRGADDYITKPFGTAELVARVEALERRLAPPPEPAAEMVVQNGGRLISGDFMLELRERRLWQNGVSMELSRVEYQILEYFFQHPDVPLSRADILHTVWGDENFSDEKIVDVNMRRLRMKIEPNPSEPQHIITVWGRGYRWRA